MKALTFPKKHDTLTFDTEKAVKRKSIPEFLHQRGDGWCKSLRKRGEGAFEPRSGNAPPVPAVTGTECVSARYEFRWNHGLLFALSRNTGSGRFLSSWAHQKENCYEEH